MVIELQLTKDKATIAGGNVSTQRLASFETQLTALSADVEDLRLTPTDPQPLGIRDTFSTSLEKISYTNYIEAMLLESEISSDTSSDAGSQLILIPSTSPRSESPLSGNPPLAHRHKEQMRAQIEHRMFPGPKPVLYGGAMCDHLELVLFNIRTCYTKGSFQPERTDGKVMEPRFWTECSGSIYFFKISDLPKAQRSLRESLTVNPGDVFVSGSAVVLIEILSTLSPINTAVNPQVWKTLLAYLYKLAIDNLPRWSPIMVVVCRLYEGINSVDWSVRALTFIVDRLRANLDPAN